jgi:uncharacterized RDD family membrane protein YckC
VALDLDRRAGRRAQAPDATEPLEDPEDPQDDDIEQSEEQVRAAPALPDEGAPAPPASRLLAWAVDGALVGILAAALPALLIGAGGGAGEPGTLLLAEGFVVVVAWVYATVAHALAGATLGKRLAGLRVVGPDGRWPTPGQSAARSAWAIASIGLLGLGLLPALLAPSRRALHDLLAGTRVVAWP